MAPTTPEGDDTPPRAADIVVPMGVVAALLALLMLAVAGPGYRLGLWPFRTGFTVLGWAAWLGLGASGVSSLGAFLARRVQPRTRVWAALSGAVLGIAVAVIPWYWQQTASRLPYIHDITTDTNDPPVFVTLLAARAGAPNSADYGGRKLAVLQKAAYPDITSKVLDLPADQAFARVQAAAHSLGWDVAALVAAEGRLEAIDTTTWFGFKDDVVVRVRALDGERPRSQVDVRSVSRIGRSDLGANARRIRAFLGELTE